MTIAIAIQANDGVVIAADTQESGGYPGSLKTDQSKIRVYEAGIEARYGLCAISGAGDGGYIDALSDQLGAMFSESGQDDRSVLTSKFGACVHQFYMDHVVPFAAYPLQERPDVQVLLAVLTRKIWEPPEILLTSSGALYSGRRFAAVGAGAAHAKALLNRYWMGDQSSRMAVLAAYVVFAVKEAIDGCGKYTTVTTLHGPMIRAGGNSRELISPEQWRSEMSREEIDDLEHYFRGKYAMAERDLLLSSINRWVMRSGARQKRRRAT